MRRSGSAIFPGPKFRSCPPITGSAVPRCQFITHKGKQIAYLDLSGITDFEPAIAAIEEVKAFVQSQPKGSVRALTHVKGSRFDSVILGKVKDLAAGNRPYVAHAAVVGLGTFQKAAYLIVQHFARRTIPAFDDLEKAKDWLVEQP